MRYGCYLLDADDTLYDFPLAQARALTRALEEAGWRVQDGDIERFDSIIVRLWKMFETGGITQDQLVVKWFTEFLCGDEGFSDVAIAEAYVDALAREGPMLSGAMDVVRELKRRGAKTAIVTNGVGKIQRGRFAVSGVEGYVDALIISEEVGAFKPDPAMIEAALTALGCADRTRALMVGDTFGTDVLAAQRAGIDCCWYNPSGQALPDGCAPPTYEIRAIEELLQL